MGVGSLLGRRTMALLERVVIETPRGPKVEVDNRTPGTLEVLVDGVQVGKVAEFRVRSFEVEAGERTVAVTSGGRELDRSVIHFKPATTFVFCPGGAGGYCLQCGRHYPPPRRHEYFKINGFKRSADQTRRRSRPTSA